MKKKITYLFLIKSIERMKGMTNTEIIDFNIIDKKLNDQISNNSVWGIYILKIQKSN